jgi:hypothetical protein
LAKASSTKAAAEAQAAELKATAGTNEAAQAAAELKQQHKTL